VSDDIRAKSTDPVLLSGEGSVYRRGPGWKAAYHVDGRRRTFRAATAREARERLKEVLQKLERGETLPDERISVADFVEYWLAAIEPTIRPSTHKRYREYVRVHAVPENRHLSVCANAARRPPTTRARRPDTHDAISL
jgi:hypothetical protein